MSLKSDIDSIDILVDYFFEDVDKPIWDRIKRALNMFDDHMGEEIYNNLNGEK